MMRAVKLAADDHSEFAGVGRSLAEFCRPASRLSGLSGVSGGLERQREVLVGNRRPRVKSSRFTQLRIASCGRLSTSSAVP